MTPQEKAKELVDRYCKMESHCDDAIECALIAVDEINKAIDFDWMEVQNLESQHRFWEQVKTEIEKL